MDRYFVRRGEGETLQIWSRELDGKVGFARPWETAGETLVFDEADAAACIAENGGEAVPVPLKQEQWFPWAKLPQPLRID